MHDNASNFPATEQVPATAPATRWSTLTRGDADAYQRCFDDLAAQGHDVHGEARFIATQVAAGSRILDAGCGTGRVTTKLNHDGYICVGVDVDPEMITVARRRDPDILWLVADLTQFELPHEFDAAVTTGNVIPLLAPATLPIVMRQLRDHVRRGGLVISGFGLNTDHLPDGCEVTTLSDYDAACEAAGLKRIKRFSTWDQQPWTPNAPYAVTVHVRR